MESAHELFVHELQEMMDAEQQLVEALGKQSEESFRPDLRKAFQFHQAQTKKQVERLQQVLSRLARKRNRSSAKESAD